MLKYQRDRLTFNVLRNLALNLYKAITFKVRSDKVRLEWQQILIADNLRIVGLYKMDYCMATKVQESTSCEKHKFWSIRVSGVALQYAGNMEGAERAFLKSQDYGSELSLSFSLQHLGKLYVELKDYKLALEKFTEALRIREKLK